MRNHRGIGTELFVVFKSRLRTRSLLTRLPIYFFKKIGPTHDWRAAIFTRATLCYSADTSYGPVSVCPSQFGVLSKRLNKSSWWELSSTCPTLCFKEIRVSPKIRVLPAGTPDLENFTTAYRSSKRVINVARQMWTPRA